MLKQSKEASRHVESVLSALDIIDCFQFSSELSLKEIIDATGLTRSRAMRLIGTLESKGYLVGNPDTKRYSPGIKWPIIAKSYENVNQVEVLIRPVLKQLATDTKESATYYVRDGLERVALAREEGSHNIRYVIHEGGRYRLSRGGAAGKVLLAFGPDGLLDEVCAEGDVDDKAFRASVDKARQQGYYLSRGGKYPRRVFHSSARVQRSGRSFGWSDSHIRTG